MSSTSTMTMFGRRSLAGGGALFWVSAGAAHVFVRNAAATTNSRAFNRCLRCGVPRALRVRRADHDLLDADVRASVRDAVGLRRLPLGVAAGAEHLPRLLIADEIEV